MTLLAFRRFLLPLIVLRFLNFPAAVSGERDYHVIMRYSLGGSGTYDYITIDSSARRLYLTEANRVVVLDLDHRNVLGEINGLRMAQRVALVKEVRRGFISDGAADRVLIFDPENLKIQGEIKTDGKPDCILYDPASRYLFSFNGRGKNASVIDPAKGAVVATIPLGGRPEFAAADGQGMVYVNNRDTSEVIAIDSRGRTVKARWPIAPAVEPSSMAIDREHRRLFIGARNKFLVVMDADNGKVIQSLPIGGMVDAGAYEPETGLVFTSEGEGTLHIFHEDSPNRFSLIQTVYTPPGARTMGLDPKTHDLFLVTAEFGPPPPPTTENPNPQPLVMPGTFTLLVYGR